MARRGSSSEELRKRREKNQKDLVESRSKVKFEQNRKNKGGGGSSTSTPSTKGKTKAQLLAIRNKERYGGTAKAAAANKAAMKLKIKKAYLAKKKKRSNHQ